MSHKKEPLPVQGPIYVRVNKPGDPRHGHIGEWIGISAAIIGPLAGKVIVAFEDGGTGAYREGELAWIHDAPAGNPGR
jgi:hypothetical protein